jgi:glycine betaine/proline transport system permease protein
VSTFLFISLSILVIPTLFGEVIPALAVYPETITITTGEFINRIVKWINIELYFIFRTAKDAILIYIFLPLKKFLLYIPWLPLLLMLTFGGFQLGGKKLALLSASMFLFIAVAGLWDKAMVTIYLCGVSVVIAYGLGVPLGIWAARNDRVHGIILVVIDTLQTMPSFVYLIPVVMLFGIGDFPAMIAIVAYAIAPAIRYTDHGIRHVPETIVEAARSAGCTDRQVLWMVQFPLAFPEILLGLNQTIMMALSMLVITALVGTSGLGQEVFIALSNAAPGLGIVTGLSIAFIAIVADRMITSWTSRRKRELGFE